MEMNVSPDAGYTSGMIQLRTLLIGTMLTASAFSPTPEHAHGTEATVLELAQEFRRHLQAGNIPAASSMLVEWPRRWFERREGPGFPWRIADGETGPWANWDRHFQSRKEVIGWRADGLEAVVTLRETNDYFQLLERGSVTNEIVYFFNSDFKISGHLVRARGPRPPGRTKTFLRWAQTHEPRELDYLMPSGEIDPSGDRPARMRELLERWRNSVEIIQ